MYLEQESTRTTCKELQTTVVEYNLDEQQGSDHNPDVRTRLRKILNDNREDFSHMPYWPRTIGHKLDSHFRNLRHARNKTP